MDIERLKGLVEKHRGRILAVAEEVWKHPETGYREWKTHAYLLSQFEALGYAPTLAGNIPGFYVDVDTGRPGPKLALLGELDSVICHNHPNADPETGAVHACGHHAQCATLVGLAAALAEPGALEGLCGSIRLMAVPAEELLELGYRAQLREQGIIRYFGGKVEFIHRGYFDGVDMAAMIHAGGGTASKTCLTLAEGTNGCVVKNITFLGKAAHAGGAPHDGVNALYAATCAINAANALRETFRDEDHVRFHPIVTEGGLAVNVIPERAKLESYVRGATFDAIVAYNEKINRAMAGSAAAVGGHVTLSDMPGYFPLQNDHGMNTVLGDAMRAVAGPDSVVDSAPWGTGCTDMGDVAAIMPAAHPHASGCIGTGHGSDYFVEDVEKAYILPTECLLTAAALLLENGAERGRKVISEAKPRFASKEAYLKAIDALFVERDAVRYQGDGTAVLDWASKP